MPRTLLNQSGGTNAKTHVLGRKALDQRAGSVGLYRGFERGEQAEDSLRRGFRAGMTGCDQQRQQRCPGRR